MLLLGCQDRFLIRTNLWLGSQRRSRSCYSWLIRSRGGEEVGEAKIKEKLEGANLDRGIVL